MTAGPARERPFGHRATLPAMRARGVHVRPRGLTAVLLLGGLLAAGLVAPSSAGAASVRAAAPLPPKLSPVFVPRPCWWPIPGSVPASTTITCGTVDVPEDHTDRRGRRLTLPVVRIHRAGADAAAPPILYTHGGPGGDVLTGAPAGLATQPALAERDLIAFDQRGAGLAIPDLNCPEKEEAVLAALGSADPWPADLERNRTATRACRLRLRHAKVDLDQYDTIASTKDMEWIRQALGVDTWSLWGASYATRLHLAYARRYPERVRSMLLDSVYPPHVGSVERAQHFGQDALDRLVAACTADTACHTKYGDLGALLDQATASFDANPAVLQGTFVLRGQSVTRSFVLTGADLRAGLFGALYDSTLIPILPSVIAQMAAGNRAIVPAFIASGVPRLLDLSEGAYLSVDCADSERLYPVKESRAALKGAAADGTLAISTATTFCPDWKVEPLAASFNRPVTVATPTLVFGGTLDPVTPYPDSQAQAARMPGARFVTVPRAGHGAASFNSCTRSAVTSFFHDAAAPLPACLATLAPLPFS